MYQKGSLDCYDTVILPGEYHNSPIREIEHKRGLKAKKLIALGSLYLDTLIAEMRQSHIPTQDRCILVASSWGDKGLLKQYGIQPFIELARKDWQVIIRPHPHSFKHEPDLINKLQRQSANIPNVVWDTKLSPVEAMSRAVLMISDTSSVRFDFAFIYERPVLSLEIPVENMPGFERDDLNEIWSEKAAFRLAWWLARMKPCKTYIRWWNKRLMNMTLREFVAIVIQMSRILGSCQGHCAIPHFRVVRGKQKMISLFRNLYLLLLSLHRTISLLFDAFCIYSLLMFILNWLFRVLPRREAECKRY
jgi:hypothetical protein